MVLPAGYGDGLAGRSFTVGDTRYTLADFTEVALHLTFDVAARTTTGHAEIRFRPVESGVPFFLLKPTTSPATLDGQPVPLRRLRDPDNVAALTSIDATLPAGSEHILAFDYVLTSATYSSTGVDFVTTMYDVLRTDPPDNYFEAYGPASIEADQYHFVLDIELVGATVPHRLFANGTPQSTAPGRWTIDFPASYSTSSFFVHLSEIDYAVREASYHGLEREIPIVVYGSRAEDVDAGMDNLLTAFAELEATFGPYSHASFIADVVPGGGGMEHVGATVSGVVALSHELCHSWFGRGVLPADGRSGWIDEAICTWRDFRYQRPPGVTTVGTRPDTNLATYSIWYQPAPDFFHVPGWDLMTDLDIMTADAGGLRPILRDFYADWRGRPITTEQFLDYLKARTDVDLDAEFDEHVYGGNPPIILHEAH